MLQHRKHKLLSKLIAITFAINAISPVAFAAEETTATTNKSGQLSLASVQSDILTRIAQTEANTFKNKKLNITEEEMNNLMNVPLSTTDDNKYYTQEEKDYNNLQLLIAQGLNTKEKRAEALNKLEAIEELSKTDKSVGGLTSTEKYVKTLLENYEDIESRAGSSGALGSAITPTDSSIIAYKTILKVAKAERQACRNDATANKAKADKGEKLKEGTNTDPDSCTLSERGQEAAQILTYLTNQQINQTTDAPKTTNATNATTTATGERTCADTTKRPAANNIYKCCPTDKPYINTSTGKCDTKTQNDSKDDDDDDNQSNLLGTLLAGSIMSKSCLQDPTKCVSDGEPLGTGGTRAKTANKSSGKKTGSLDTKSKDNTISKSAKGTYTPEFAKRVGKVTLEFNEKSGAEKLSDGKIAYVHIGESNTEFQVKVNLSGNTTPAKDKDGKEQKPIKVNVYSYNYLSNSESTSVYFNAQKNKNPNEFITVVYPENKGVNGVNFKKIPKEQPYPLYIEITDGTSRIFYTAYYKIYDMKAMISDQIKQTSANEIEILPNEDEDYGLTHGTIQGKLKGATWENDKCNLQVSGKYSGNDNENMNFDSSVSYEQINKDDCTKLNDKAKNSNLEITLEHASVSVDSNGDNLAFDANNTINPTIKDVDTGEYMTEEQFKSEFKSTGSYVDSKVSIPFGKSADGHQVNYDVGTGKFMQFTEEGWKEMTNKEISDGFLNGKEIPEGAEVKFTLGVLTGLPAISINKDDYEVDQHQLSGKTKRSKDVIDGKVGIPSLTEEVTKSVEKTFKDLTVYDTVKGVVTADNPVQEAANKIKQTETNIKQALKDKRNKKQRMSPADTAKTITNPSSVDTENE